MHPWHDVPLDESKVSDRFPVIIEVPRGSKNKYELDKETGLLRLDRVLYSAVHYPADYGFVPQTLCGDGDALDVLVLAQAPVDPLTLVEARAIGMFRMRDDAGEDDKIIAVSLGDPAYNHIHSYGELPKHVLTQIRRFFQDYKVLEHKEVIVDDLEGPGRALEVIRDSIAMYKESYGDSRK